MVKDLRRLFCILICMSIVLVFPSESFASYDGDMEEASSEDDADDSDDGDDSEDSDDSEEVDETETIKENIRAKENEIAQARQEVENLKSNLTDVEKIKEELEMNKNNLTSYVTELDTRLAKIQDKITEYNDLIAKKEVEIKLTTEELNDSIRTQEQQYEAMKQRIRFMYEKGDTLYLELIFSAESFADVINKADYIEALSAYDRNQLDEYVRITELITICKEDLEVQKEVLDEARTTVQEEEVAINALIGEKEAQIVAVSSDISDREAAIKEYEDEIAAQNAEISALEKAVAEEKARLAEQNAETRVYDGGMFTWPCPAYTRISDEYGNRMHPILNVLQFHNGLDMAAPYGSAILAAYDGDVIAADYSASMGNYIMLDHGDGLYTIYMHSSALYVSKGESVYKGQKIAAVGSTGRSTGNHLHFSVRLNGNYVSPWNYLK